MKANERLYDDLQVRVCMPLQSLLQDTLRVLTPLALECIQPAYFIAPEIEHVVRAVLRASADSNRVNILKHHTCA
jgi:hypothetical protein